MTQLIDTYIYCTVCQAKLNRTDNLKACPKCGKRYYFNALPNVTIVITNARDEILLFQRTKEPFKGWWDMPGGFVNEGESLEQAVIREAEEEIGTIVIKPQYITSLPATYDHLGITHNLVLILFRANLQDESTLRQTEEAFNYTFFAKKDLPENIAFDAQRAFLRTYVVRS